MEAMEAGNGRRAAAVRVELGWGSEQREGRQPPCLAGPDGSARVGGERGKAFSMCHVSSADPDIGFLLDGREQPGPRGAWLEGWGGSVAEGPQLPSCL